MDGDMQSSVIEIIGANVSTNFISCPSDPKQTLGIKMPYLVLLIKYVNLLSDYWINIYSFFLIKWNLISELINKLA